MATGNNPYFRDMAGRVESFVVYQLNGQTVLRGRPGPRTSFTGKEHNNRTRFASIGRAWTQNVPENVKAQWKRLAVRVPRWGDDGLPVSVPMTGHQCFVMVNRARQSLKLPLLVDCPSVPNLPPFLGEVRVTVGDNSGCLPALVLSEGNPSPALPETGRVKDFSYTLPASGGDGGGFLSATDMAGGGLPPAGAKTSPLPLTLTPDAAFDWPVQIWAASGILENAPMPPARRFAQIAVLPAGLPVGGVDVGQAFADAGLTLWPGEKVCVRVVPLSVTGFKGQPVTTTGLRGG